LDFLLDGERNYNCDPSRKNCVENGYDGVISGRGKFVDLKFKIMVETYSHVCVKILRGSVLWTRDCSISKLCNGTTIKITAGNIFRTLLHLFVDKLLLRHKVGDKFSPFRIPYIITLQEFIFLLP